MMFFVSSTFAKEWYEGGNLHDASALKWQQATYENKLATCSDFVANAWKKKLFRADIQNELDSQWTLKGVKSLSIKLVAGVDAAYKKEPNQEANIKLFKNQDVASTATTLMIMMGWLKK